ncbi:MAG: type II toxin-antitoxin system VapC family toxin [Dehalococcoidales bacterium]|nr:type II toxin-antitoxin system VapC family toxin [Dehalococcoidales bacterium]
MKVDVCCLDASVAVPWLLPNQQDARADALLLKLLDSKTDLVAAPFFNAEVTSAIRLRVFLKQITLAEGESAFQRFMALEVNQFNHPSLDQVAWELAKKYNTIRTYDMYYLAVAELLDCALWTNDKRLYNVLQGRNQRVRCLDDI